MRRRILVTMMALSSVAVLALFVPATIALRQAGQRRDLLDVQRDASIVASLIPTDGPIAFEELAAGLGPDRRLGIYSGDGRLISGWGPARADPVLVKGLSGSWSEGRVNGDLVAVVPVRVEDGRPTLVVRVEEDGRNSLGRAVATISALGLVALAVIASTAVAGSYLAARLHRPIDTLRRWSESDLLDVDGAPEPTGIAELDGLRSTLVESRTRVAGLLHREQLFSSWVSHQLRTPVTAIRVAMETELDTPRVERSEILVESLGALDQLESTINTLLALGRNTGQSAIPTDLRSLLDARVRLWEPRFSEAGRSVDVDGQPLSIDTNPPAIEHIVDVLLENALRHGRGDATASALDGDHFVSVIVEDQGTIPPGANPLLEAGHGSSGGIGLGLARSLADAVGGSLDLACGRPTTFRLKLPKPSCSDDAALTIR